MRAPSGGGGVSSGKLIGAQQRESLTSLPPFITSSCWGFTADQEGDNAAGMESVRSRRRNLEESGWTAASRDRRRSLERSTADILANQHPSW